MHTEPACAATPFRPRPHPHRSGAGRCGRAFLALRVLRRSMSLSLSL